MVKISSFKRRVFDFYRSNNLYDFVRNIFYFLITKKVLIIHRKFKALFYLKNYNVILGPRFNIIGLPKFINIGDFTNFLDNNTIEIGASAKLEVGKSCIFSYGVIISCMESIEIGNDVQIGEYTSIRDSTHDYSDFGVPMKYNKDISKGIIIGNNVWIGRGCIILPGTIIEDGVVVGANSVVKGHLTTNNIYVGSPVKIVKSRIL
jgi:acetyltransferase-like isoleucine patch superfamily enzyme